MRLPRFLNEKFRAKFLIDCDIESLENVHRMTVHLRILIFNDIKFIRKVAPMNTFVGIVTIVQTFFACIFNTGIVILTDTLYEAPNSVS